MAVPSARAAQAEPPARWMVFALLAGLFFFLVIIKLGAPVILDRNISAPQDFSSAFYFSWPPSWGLWMFPPVALAGLFAIDWKGWKYHWVLALPLLWLGWELLAATHTINAALTMLTLVHFAICGALFYLGYFARKEMARSWPIWAGMGLALCWGMRAGMEQHFGGLEATRKMYVATMARAGVDAKALADGTPLTQEQARALIKEDIDPKAVADPDFWKRINDNRIFSTFGNPNTFAGGLILLLPLTLVFVWRLTPKVRRPMRILFVLILGWCGLACLYWSGSKAGWLVALAIGLAALGHSALPLKWKRWVILGALAVGIAGFVFKYASYFQKERNSVGARFAYWRAALIVIDHHPLLGTGPGTFQIPYAQIKRPGDEMARLCHNDYLEQASDSGVLGFITYTGMVLALLSMLYRYSTGETPINWFNFAVWLGLAGLCLHSIVDFHLYVASLAWPLFFLFGWLMRADN
ncbi:MAG TPA: O-antigen ligase family protein [Verrucomicrobiae bacterium]